MIQSDMFSSSSDEIGPRGQSDLLALLVRMMTLSAGEGLDDISDGGIDLADAVSCDGQAYQVQCNETNGSCRAGMRKTGNEVLGEARERTIEHPRIFVPLGRQMQRVYMDPRESYIRQSMVWLLERGRAVGMANAKVRRSRMVTRLSKGWNNGREGSVNC